MNCFFWTQTNWYLISDIWVDLIACGVGCLWISRVLGKYIKTSDYTTPNRIYQPFLFGFFRSPPAAIQNNSSRTPEFIGVLMEGNPFRKPELVGKFNPFEKYESKWESSPYRGEHTKNVWFETTTLPPSAGKSPTTTTSLDQPDHPPAIMFPTFHGDRHAGKLDAIATWDCDLKRFQKRNHQRSEVAKRFTWQPLGKTLLKVKLLVGCRENPTNKL